MTNNKVRQIKEFESQDQDFINLWLQESRNEIEVIDIFGGHRDRSSTYEWMVVVVYEIDYDKISEFESLMEKRQRDGKLDEED